MPNRYAAPVKVPAGLKITLTKQEDKTLRELELANQVPRRTKQRASMLRLNSRGKTVKEIAGYLECASSTVRQTIHRWQSNNSRSRKLQQIL